MGKILYAGRCTSRNERSATIAVEAQKLGDRWSTLEPSLLKQFSDPKAISATGADIRDMHVGDWVIYSLAKAQRHHWTAAACRLPSHFLDLSSLGSVDTVQTMLLASGVETAGNPGLWIIRINETEIICAELYRKDERHLLARPLRYESYAFESESLIEIPYKSSSVMFSQFKPRDHVSIYNWEPDGDFLKRIADATGVALGSKITQLIDYLECFAITKLHSTDIGAANDALRTGEIAQRFSRDAALLQQFASALFVSSKTTEQLEGERERIAQEMCDAIRQEESAKLAAEINAERNRRMIVLEQEIADKQQAQFSAAELLFATQQNQLTAKLNAEYDKLRQEHVDEDKRERAQLKETLARHKTDIEQEIATRVSARDDVSLAIIALEEQQHSASQRIAALKEEETTLGEQLELLVKSVQIAREQADAAIDREARRTPPESLMTIRKAKQRQLISPPKLRGIIDKSQLLTEHGKMQLEQFVALMLAGEVPIIHGPQATDFLIIAETLLSAGNTARLYADPTMITFSDLWVRAGSQQPTELGQALQLASCDNSYCTLGVIEGAERSGARFWHPALRAKAARGALPRQLFLCTTIHDLGSEEAQALRGNAFFLEIADAVNFHTASLTLFEQPELYELIPHDMPPIDGHSLHFAIKPAQNSLESIGRIARYIAELATFGLSDNEQKAWASTFGACIRPSTQPELKSKETHNA